MIKKSTTLSEYSVNILQDYAVTNICSGCFVCTKAIDARPGIIYLRQTKEKRKSELIKKKKADKAERYKKLADKCGQS